MTISPVAPAGSRRCLVVHDRHVRSGGRGRPIRLAARRAATGCWPSGARPRSSRTPRSPARAAPLRARAITAAGSGADEERTKRRRCAARACRVPRQLGEDRLVHGRHGRVPGRLQGLEPGKNRAVANPGVQTTLPPAASDASSAATRPWMWNSGITFRQRSRGESSSVRGDVARPSCTDCAWVSGTSLGRDGGARRVQQQRHVVRVRAASSSAQAGAVAAVDREASGRPVALPSRIEAADAERRCDRARGSSIFGRQQQRRGLQVRQAEPEFVLAVAGIERRAHGARRDRDRGRRHLGTVRQHHGNAVAAPDAGVPQRGESAPPFAAARPP